MLAIHNAEIVDDGRRFNGYIVVDGSIIIEVGEGEIPEHYKDGSHELVNASGRMLIPGAIDTHVHFRDGGNGSPKGDISTESRAAVTGGVTSYFDMPNTAPPTIDRESWQCKMKHAAATSYANYAFFPGVTNSNIDELKQLDFNLIPGLKLFMGSSTGNMLVDDKSTISRLFRDFNCVIAVHAENQTIINENSSEMRRRYPYGEVPVELHPKIRSREACLKSSSDAIALAEATGARLHVLHISTADELPSTPPSTPLEQRNITRETCPHYLIFGGKDDYLTHGTRIKCNPAIKEISDRDALRQAVADGRIDIIATDHAPHLPADKKGGALTAASGMPSIQFSLPLMMTLADQGILTVEKVVELMCNNPARLYNIDRRGFLRKGYYADMVLIGNNRHTISDNDVVSLCGWTPYDGIELSRSVDRVWVNGHAPEQGKAMAIKFCNR